MRIIPNSKCPASDMCFDETTEKNKFVCVANKNCLKMIVFYAVSEEHNDVRTCIVTRNAKLESSFRPQKGYHQHKKKVFEGEKDKCEDFIGYFLVENSWDPRQVEFFIAMIEFYEPRLVFYFVFVGLALIILPCLTFISTKAIFHNKKKWKIVKKMRIAFVMSKNMTEETEYLKLETMTQEFKSKLLSHFPNIQLTSLPTNRKKLLNSENEPDLYIYAYSSADENKRSLDNFVGCSSYHCQFYYLHRVKAHKCVGITFKNPHSNRSSAATPTSTNSSNRKRRQAKSNNERDENETMIVTCDNNASPSIRMFYVRQEYCAFVRHVIKNLLRETSQSDSLRTSCLVKYTADMFLGASLLFYKFSISITTFRSRKNIEFYANDEHVCFEFA